MGEVAACGRIHPGACAWIGDTCMQPESAEDRPWTYAEAVDHLIAAMPKEALRCPGCIELEAQLAAARSALAACREVAGKRAGGDA